MGAYGEKDPQVKAALDLLQTDPDEAAQKAQEVLSTAQGRSDKALQVRARIALSAACLQQGDVRKASEEARAALRDVPADAGDLRSGALRAVVAAALQEGNTDTALREASDAIQQCKSRRDDRGEAAAHVLTGEAYAALEDYDAALEAAGRAKAIFDKLAAQERDEWAGYSLLKLSELYASAWRNTDALTAAGDALAVFRGKGDRAGEGWALRTAASAALAGNDVAAALDKVQEALSIFRALNDTAAQAAVLRTKAKALVAAKRHDEARRAANEVAEVFRASGDGKGQAAAALFEAEVCIQTLHSTQAAAAARQALELFRASGSRAGQAAALTAIVASTYEDASDEAVAAAEEKVLLFQCSTDMYQEADALLALGNLLVARIGTKIARCKLASTDDSVAALRAAKDAHAKYVMVGNALGMENAVRAVAQVLLYNNVPSEVVESVRDPEEVFQDVMAGKYADSKNALPKPEVQQQPRKLEEIVPSAKQLDRAKFAWNTPLAGYSYTLIWQPAKERKVRGRRPRGSYDIMTLNSGHTRTMTAPVIAQMRGNDAIEARADSLVVHVLGTDCKESYASTVMEVVQVMGCMITARVPRLVFVLLDETHFDHTDTSVREPNMYPVVLGLLRSMRIEAPNVTVGFVAGDAASWLSNPVPMIESIFDSIECDESEVIYKKGDPYAPLLVHRELDEPVTYVKPKQKHPYYKPGATPAR